MTSLLRMIAWLTPCAITVAAPAADPPKADARKGPPEEYVVDYPTAKLFCGPIQSTFIEVTQRIRTVKGRQFRQKRNGGFGLPIVDKVDGKNLIHVGADLGWRQVGEPVFAVADGVVRVSEGPEFDPKEKTKRNAPLRVKPGALWLPWGNVVAIEHRLPSGKYVTSVYGHLSTQRRVRVGDVVRAGQWIGTIGKQHPRINGGYKPHLHFGVREGRAAEVGATLFHLSLDGKRTAVKIVAVNEETIEVSGEPLARLSSMTLNGKRHAIRRVDGKYTMAANLLWSWNPPDFALVGYELSTDRWLDPVRFLRLHRADTQPARYRR